MITTKTTHWRFSLLTSKAIVLGIACTTVLPSFAASPQVKPIDPVKMEEAAPPWEARSDALAKAADETPVQVDTPQATRTENTPDMTTNPAEVDAETVTDKAAAPTITLANLANDTQPAARSGNSSMETWYRNRRQKAAKPNTAIGEIQAAAEKGDADSQYELGVIYQGGRGVPQDMTKAKQWFTQAAQKGHARAQYALALLYRSEDGGDVSQSLKWQRQSAQGGYAEAQYGLGLLYANGQYLQRDPEQAREWFQRAAAQGHVAANLVLLSTQSAGTATAATEATPTAAEPSAGNTAADAASDAALPMPSSAPTDTADSGSNAAADSNDEMDLTGVDATVVKQSAEEGNVNAQLMLGTMYEDGLGGLQPDLSQAAHWYEQAANQGYAKAEYNLALLYEDGRGVKQDYKQAAYWYDKAVKAGFTEAQNNLGVLYVLGNGVKKDTAKAKALFSDAAAKGNANAERNLSMLKNG